MKKNILLTILVFVLFSCDITYISNDKGSDHLSSLKYLRDQIRDHYVYTEFKNYDVQSRYDYYKSLVHNSMEDEEFFFILKQYTNELRDAHSNIVAPFATSSYYPDITGESGPGYNSNYNKYTVNQYYINNDLSLGYKYQVLGSSLKNGVIIRNDKKYGYIYYESFMNVIGIEEIEDIIKRFEDLEVEGIVLDIRSNGGGMLTNMITLASYFGYDSSSEKVKLAKVWRRDGKNEYTELDGLNLAPFFDVSFTVKRAGNSYKGPVALLTNRGSYSASSFTATAFKNFPNVKQIGDYTGGGMGLPIGGTLPNGWTYRLSGNVVLSADARGISDITDPTYNWEDGVPADINATDDPNTVEQDEIIDRAIEWINIGN